MTLQTQHTANTPAVLTQMNRAGEWQMPSRTLSQRTPAGTMPASTASFVNGVNVKINQHCRLWSTTTILAAPVASTEYVTVIFSASN